MSPLGLGLEKSGRRARGDPIRKASPMETIFLAVLKEPVEIGWYFYDFA
jgi:hypothetical protein